MPLPIFGKVDIREHRVVLGPRVQQARQELIFIPFPNICDLVGICGLGPLHDVKKPVEADGAAP